MYTTSACKQTSQHQNCCMKAILSRLTSISLRCLFTSMDMRCGVRQAINVSMTCSKLILLENFSGFFLPRMAPLKNCHKVIFLRLRPWSSLAWDWFSMATRFNSARISRSNALSCQLKMLAHAKNRTSCNTRATSKRTIGPETHTPEHRKSIHPGPQV
jgi:hypothetical protein